MKNCIQFWIPVLIFIVYSGGTIGAQEIFYNHHTFEQVSLTDGDSALYNLTEDFYATSDPITIRIESDFTHFKENKEEKDKQPAVLHVQCNENISMRCEVKIKPRGKSRLEYCFLPPIKIDFTDSGLQATNLSQLEKVKMVSKCRRDPYFEDYVTTEYLIYKMYNAITPISFRVRFAIITFVDTGNNGDEWTDYGFIIEETDAVARRTHIEETKDIQTKINQEIALNLSMFQFMISNTDWHLPSGHNVKYFMSPDLGEESTLIVPYDFDLSGMVKPKYGVPRPELNQTSLRHRRFISFTPSEADLDRTVANFQESKTDFYQVVDGFDYMSEKKKKDILKFLDSFFKILDNPSKIKQSFIEGSIGYNW